MIQVKRIIITVLYKLNAKFSKSFARSEYNFLNNSEIEKKSKVNPSFAFKQILVQSDLFYGRSSCLNIFQFLGGRAVFLYIFLKVCFFLFSN